jgi:ribosomal protein L40E
MATVAHRTEAHLAIQFTPRARPMRSHRAVRVQCMRCGAVLTSASATKRRQCLHLDLLHRTSYKPQHEDLGEGGQREVLTGEAVRVAVAYGVEGENSG